MLSLLTQIPREADTKRGLDVLDAYWEKTCEGLKRREQEQDEVPPGLKAGQTTCEEEQERRKGEVERK